MDASPRIAPGERIYAIGDIHGRLDLFGLLVRRIRLDDAQLPAKRTRLLLIGDMVDRGPESRRLVEHLMRRGDDPNMIVLRGNHEEMMIRALAGDVKTLEAWLRFGGDATLRSWGVPEDLLESDPATLSVALGEFVPADVIAWLRSLPIAHHSGDFFFVHAGIEPGVPLLEQSRGALLWIGEEFLDFEGMHPAIIVHGHTIVETGPEFRPNRIALDTGAYRTGRLSAVGFDDSRQWTITAEDGGADRAGNARMAEA